eukprot:gene22823-168_t
MSRAQNTLTSNVLQSSFRGASGMNAKKPPPLLMPVPDSARRTPLPEGLCEENSGGRTPLSRKGRPVSHDEAYTTLQKLGLDLQLKEYLRNRHGAKTCDPKPTGPFAKGPETADWTRIWGFIRSDSPYLPPDLSNLPRILSDPCWDFFLPALPPNHPHIPQDPQMSSDPPSHHESEPTPSRNPKRSIPNASLPATKTRRTSENTSLAHTAHGNFAATLSQEHPNLRGQKRCLSEAPSPAPKFPRAAVTSTQSSNSRLKLDLCNLSACDLDPFLESYTNRNHTSVFRCNLCRTVWPEHLPNFKECDNLKQSKSGVSARLNAQQHVIRALHHERYISPVLNTEGATLFKCTFCQPETPSCVHPNLRDTFRHISSLDKLRQVILNFSPSPSPSQPDWPTSTYPFRSPEGRALLLLDTSAPQPISSTRNSSQPNIADAPDSLGPLESSLSLRSSTPLV